MGLVDIGGFLSRSEFGRSLSIVYFVPPLQRKATYIVRNISWLVVALLMKEFLLHWKKKFKYHETLSFHIAFFKKN
jgi:hypothetical protein